MPLNIPQSSRLQQSGASLIEVLVAVLILSFGMLALGGMMSYAVQLPKLAGYRSSATTIAASMVDRMRANSAGFAAGAYQTASSTYLMNPLPNDPSCIYPNCNISDIATLDKNETTRALRRELPGGPVAGISVTCPTGCAAMEGQLYVIWDEPTFISSLNNSSSDECPAGITPSGGTPPRCVLVRFKL